MKLSDKEIKLLYSLAHGKTYAEARFCFSPQLSTANVHVTAYDIRRKTGIRQTRDPRECKRFLDKLSPQRIAEAVHGRKPTGSLTFCMLDAFRLVVLGRSYDQMAATLGVNRQSVQNLLSRACKRAGISHGGWNRKQRIREWLARHEGKAPERNPMNDPAFN